VCSLFLSPSAGAEIDALPEPSATSKVGALVDPDGTVHAPAFSIPLTQLESPEARQLFLRDVAQPASWPAPDIQKWRSEMDSQFFKPRIARLLELFSVSIEPKTIAGVYTDVVTPTAGIAEENKDRVLINLHGGGFIIGARLGGQAESIPVVHTGRIKVITVDYREAPEHKFPAASEDVAIVYAELLKTYKPENIGIYGCSAGGILTAESVVWFQHHNLPRPGAVGIFCSGAASTFDGYSSVVGPVLNGIDPVAFASGMRTMLAAYFSGTDPDDPLVSPVRSPEALAKFPPTLLISGTRDAALSSAVYTHTQLVKAGVDAELHVWEGLGHGEYNDPDIPEAKEAEDAIVRFFERHLGSQALK